MQKKLKLLKGTEKKKKKGDIFAQAGFFATKGSNYCMFISGKTEKNTKDPISQGLQRKRGANVCSRN